MSDFILSMTTSGDGRVLATSSDNETIKLWDTSSLAAIATVQPGFSGGSERLAIDHASHRLFSGTWENGLTCYDYAARRIVWHRPDLIGIQQVRWSTAFPGSLFVALEAPESRWEDPGVLDGVVELDASTGRVRWQTDEATDVYVHPAKPIYVLVDSALHLIYLFDSSRHLLGSVEMKYFAVLDVAFLGERIALAEGAEGVRVLDLRGNVIGHFRPDDRETNCIALTFTASADEITVHDYSENSHIVHLDDTAHFQREIIRERGDVCFIGDGSRYLDQDGRIFRTSEGTLAGTIAF